MIFRWMLIESEIFMIVSMYLKVEKINHEKAVLTKIDEYFTFMNFVRSQQELIGRRFFMQEYTFL